MLSPNQNQQWAELKTDLNLRRSTNAENIKKDLKRFLLSCDFCEHVFIGHEAASGPQVADTYCFNCTAVYCEPCFKRVHADEHLAHNPVSLGSVILAELPCPKTSWLYEVL